MRETSVNFLDDDKVSIELGDSEPMKIQFYAIEKIRKPYRRQKQKSIERFKKAIELIKNTKKTYSQMVKKGDEFYLECPISINVAIPTLTEKFNAMGIDRGVNRLIIACILSSKHSKFLEPLF